MLIQHEVRGRPAHAARQLAALSLQHLEAIYLGIKAIAAHIELPDETLDWIAAMDRARQDAASPTEENGQ